MFVSNEKVLWWAAVAASATVVAMLVLFLWTGVGQDPLQSVHPVSSYQQLLLANPPVLRATIGLDNLFIAFYATVFVTLSLRLKRLGAPGLLVGVVFATLSLLPLLDLIENMHFLTMISAAELGLTPTAREIEAQVMESLVKFHVSYVGLFLLGSVLPRRTAVERAVGNLNWFVQLPVGVLIYLVPRAVAVPLVLVRSGYFVLALLLIAWTQGRPGEAGRGGAGSGAPA